MGAMISKAEHDVMCSKYDAALHEKDEQINALKHQLEELKRLIFGRKSERFAPAEQPEQLALWGENAGAVQEQEEQTETYKRRKRKRKPHPGRAPIPGHLPRRRVVIEPEEDTTGMVKIGEEITTKINWQPAKVEVIDYVRPKYARPEAEQTEDQPAIVIAPVI